MIALLPGSRRSEIQYIAPSLLRAAALLTQRRPGLRFVLPVAPGLRPLLDSLVRDAAPAGLMMSRSLPSLPTTRLPSASCTGLA